MEVDDDECQMNCFLKKMMPNENWVFEVNGKVDGQNFDVNIFDLINKRGNNLCK